MSPATRAGIDQANENVLPQLVLQVDDDAVHVFAIVSRRLVEDPLRVFTDQLDPRGVARAAADQECRVAVRDLERSRRKRPLRRVEFAFVGSDPELAELGFGSKGLLRLARTIQQDPAAGRSQNTPRSIAAMANRHIRLK